MKLSRRGKSSRRVRHTKRTGKKLRYKSKKVRASKRYRRGTGDRGHTKKTHRKIYRGRVKKGGVDETHWEKEQWIVVTGDPSKIEATGKLVYKKDSTFSLTSESKYFRVILETQPELFEVTSDPPDPPYNYMKFKVTMERYKDGDNREVDKVFEVYFSFGYIVPQANLFARPGYSTAPGKPSQYYLIQLTEAGIPIKQNLRVYKYPENIYQTEQRTHMRLLFNDLTKRYYINFPEKFSNIKGYDDISNKSKFDNYIFYGTTIGLVTNWPDDDKSNTAFFNSLATQMYIILTNTVKSKEKAAEEQRKAAAEVQRKAAAEEQRKAA